MTLGVATTAAFLEGAGVGVAAKLAEPLTKRESESREVRSALRFKLGLTSPRVNHSEDSMALLKIKKSMWLCSPCYWLIDVSNNAVA